VLLGCLVMGEGAEGKVVELERGEEADRKRRLIGRARC
jgi:hypothetical protein